MTDPEWTRALVVVGMVFQVALAIDRWVHRQTDGGTRLKERLDEMSALLKGFIERAHKHNKNFQRQISRQELILALIQQRLGMRPPRPIDGETDDEDEEAS